MLRIALSNLRSTSGRLVAAGIAIAVSVAFIVASLLFAQGFGDTLANQVRASWAGADVAVLAEGDETEEGAQSNPADILTDDLTTTITGVDGVASAHLERSGFAMARTGASSMTTTVSTIPTTDTDATESGTLPQSEKEVALRAADAESLGIAVGDTVSFEEFSPAGGNGGSGGAEDTDFTVSGLLSGASPFGLTMYVTDEGLTRSDTNPAPTAIRIAAEPGIDRAALATSIADAINTTDASVLTVDEVAQKQIDQLSDSTNMLQTVGLAFGLLSVGVASLVISNTFQVLVSSRARVLALYRAVGATARQLRGATLLEGFALGVAGSAAGAVLGLVFAWGLAAVVRAFWMPDFAQLSPTPAALLVGPAVGVIVTVIAGMVPAFRAGAVSPVEALRPVDVAPATARFPWVRATIGTVLGIAGIIMCLAAASLHTVALGIVGCFVLFVAVLIAARAFVPPLIGVLGRGLAAVTGKSQTVLLAGRSASAAPGRTASTTAALLIGITLVTGVLVGAASLQRTVDLATAIDTPIDTVIDGAGSQVDGVLDETSIAEARTTVAGTTATVMVDGNGAEASGALTGPLTIVSQDGVAEGVVRSDGYEVEPGTIRLSPGELGGEGPTDDFDGRTATLTVGGEEFTLTVDGSASVPVGTALVSGEDSTRLQDAARGASAGASGSSATGSSASDAGDDTSVQQTWVRIADDATSSQIESLVSQLDAKGISADAEPALFRAQYASMFQVAIIVVLGLLTAAVVIAVIGVSNTLTLSVIDRRREGALLRALGFTRGALGRMITIESLLMTLVALVIGIGLGTFFGWVGTSSLMSDATESALSVPAVPLVLIVVAAVAAAVLASAVPARTMSRIPPAEGISLD